MQSTVTDALSLFQVCSQSSAGSFASQAGKCCSVMCSSLHVLFGDVPLESCGEQLLVGLQHVGMQSGLASVAGPEAGDALQDILYETFFAFPWRFSPRQNSVLEMAMWAISLQTTCQLQAIQVCGPDSPAASAVLSRGLVQFQMSCPANYMYIICKWMQVPDSGDLYMTHPQSVSSGILSGQTSGQCLLRLKQTHRKGWPSTTMM